MLAEDHSAFAVDFRPSFISCKEVVVRAIKIFSELLPQWDSLKSGNGRPSEPLKVAMVLQSQLDRENIADT